MTEAELVTVVVPIHNEAPHVPTMIPAMAGDVAAAIGPQELLLIENGSVDDTAALARMVCDELTAAGWKARTLTTPAADYGAAMRIGFAEAAGEWIVNFDIDYWSAEFVQQAIGAEADIVIASKRAPGSADQRSRFRRLATRVFNLILRHMLGSQVSDTHGIKAFRRHTVLRHLPDTVSNQDLFDTELILRAERAGAIIRELPVVVEERRAARSLLKRVPRTLRGIVLMRRVFRSEG